jgi:hypothetical protein
MVGIKGLAREVQYVGFIVCGGGGGILIKFLKHFLWLHLQISQSRYHNPYQ